MNNIPFTQTFSDWASLAGYQLIAKNNECLVTDFGETSYDIRSSDGMYSLTSRQRSVEQFLMSSIDVVDSERFLTALLGDDIRACRHLPRISYAAQLTDICPDCQIVDEGENRLILVDGLGQNRAIFRSPIDIADDVIWFSWILDAPLENLRASYLNPNGRPLFPECRIGPKSGVPFSNR